MRQLNERAEKERTSEVDQLRADAERYRWLRGKIAVDPAQFYVYFPSILSQGEGFIPETDVAIDAAIHAARGEKPKRGGEL